MFILDWLDEKFKIPKGKSEEGQNGKKIKDKMINTGPQNTTQKTRDITKWQTMVHKTLHRKLEI